MASIIQDIRDKYAKLTVVLIALALIGFILTDYFQSQNRAGGGSTSNSIGSVNGRSISYDDYLVKLEMNKNNMKQQGYPASAVDQQAGEQTWNQEIGRLLLEDEMDKLGITVTKKEMGDMLYGENAPAEIKSQFTDSVTGRFDPVKAKSAIEQMLKNKQTPPEQKANFTNYLVSMELSRKQDKYVSLLANTSNVPRWYAEKQNADAAQMSKISYVNEAYTAIPDSTIKISDKEIEEFVGKHKDMFKQPESRAIAYVSFSAAPSAKDSADALKDLSDKKMEFDTTADLQNFLLRENVNNYYDGYISGKTIQIAVKDSIFRTPVGSVYGPYLDGKNYTLARMEGVRTMPDTVKVRHILIGTQTRDSATAKKLADSIKLAIAGGANFDSLCVKYTDDGGSKDKGGVYENVTSGGMVAPFNDYIFLNPTGSKGVVKTEFGYHYIEIMQQKGNGPGYKIAYLSKEISASPETDKLASENAMKFAGDIKDLKTFESVYLKDWGNKQGVVKSNAPNILPSASELPGLGNSRSFVREIYDAKMGEVLKPANIDDKYVVAVVTEINDEGTMPASKARTYVEPVLRNKKKAQQLIQKVGKVTTLEAAAAALGNKPIQTVDSVRITGAKNMAYEPRIIGSSFNPANKGKVVPEALEGINGVYVVRVDDLTTTPVANGDIAAQRKAQEQQRQQQVQNAQTQYFPLNVLRGAAVVKDKRSNHM